MLHASEKYNRIQDPDGVIQDDEPVFLIRAQDATAPEVMRFWAALHLSRRGDPVLYTEVMNHAKATEEWQHTHGCKTAD